MAAALPDSFLAWCRAHGVVLGHIEAAHVGEGQRGIRATAPIQPGELLLQVLVARVPAQHTVELPSMHTAPRHSFGATPLARRAASRCLKGSS